MSWHQLKTRHNHFTHYKKNKENWNYVIQSIDLYYTIKQNNQPNIIACAKLLPEKVLEVHF